ncbi:E3 ubiquitin-protein ligase TRAIP [Patella vulgata]|uniref:E3 ubiquitin-protein ligase TRAIP n=1 Tax=Patella vulgata TaxID=6465 RepID=UPI00217F61B5|nr:E3 ubiquitin-protein ligase TRAIP [Patella vulgata]XP_050412504.1 E3 ubiquitin-protein ligase TRAIP [Patella vulgata]XP_050412505.1 E3 ubiquitin-protein ligase TRAIP [Patella vulgata]
MMRVQCCICSYLLENKDSVNIAATPCGHTFHEACLMPWIERSGTCPSCRKVCTRPDVIPKLYFDDGEMDATGEDNQTNQLLKEISTLKMKLQQTKIVLNNQISVVNKKLANQTSMLKKKVQNRESLLVNKIQELRTKISDIEEEKIKLNYCKTGLIMEKDDLEKFLAEEKSKNLILKKQVSTVAECSKKMICDLKAKMLPQKKAFNVQKNKYNQVLKDKNILLETTNSLQNRLKDIRYERDSLDQQLKYEKNMTAELKKQIFKLKEEPNNLSSKVVAYKVQFRKREVALIHKIRTADSEIAKLRRRLEIKNEEVDELKIQLLNSEEKLKMKSDQTVKLMRIVKQGQEIFGHLQTENTETSDNSRSFKRKRREI